MFPLLVIFEIKKKHNHINLNLHNPLNSKILRNFKDTSPKKKKRKKKKKKKRKCSNLRKKNKYKGREKDGLARQAKAHYLNMRSNARNWRQCPFYSFFPTVAGVSRVVITR
jgi:hypothetical protein